VEVQLHAFLTSALDGGEWSTSRPDRFTPGERAPGTHWIGGWVGSRAVLDAVVKRKIPSPRRESNPRTPIVQPVTTLKIKSLRFYLSVPLYLVIRLLENGGDTLQNQWFLYTQLVQLNPWKRRRCVAALQVTLLSWSKSCGTCKPS
jgi:hypothetical protein